ncbi:MAG: IS1634 family transposase [Clostridia bacterium]|nr:IS1634 family transposase [Clostridia bacterium]
MGRTALYRVDEFYELQDVPVLFGTEAATEDFNDSALGRTLDKIFDAGLKRVFGAAAMRAALREDVKFDVVHADTTSWSVKGLFDCSSPDDQAFYVTHGYSRNHRPDLKQLYYGLVVNGEGIPLLGHASDGNESDKVWNRRVIEELVKQFTDHLTDLVYVADSAVVAKDNLDLIVDKGIRFISRLPATFTQEQEIKDRAWSEGGWINVGVLTQNPKRDSAFYKCKEYIVDIATKTAVRPYRLIVVHSTSLDKRKAKTLEKNLLKLRDELEAQLQQLEKVEFACEPDARSALERVRSENRDALYVISGDVQAEEAVLKRSRPGRPRKEEPVPTRTVYRVRAAVGDLKEQEYAELKLRASCFVLITNMLDAEERPAETVLRDYKEQTAVELQFKAIKEPEFVGAMFVKKPERLEALAYVVLLAAMVRAIIQRRARRYAEANDEELPIPGKRITKRPTTRMILDSFDAVIVVILPDRSRALSG